MIIRRHDWSSKGQDLQALMTKNKCILYCMHHSSHINLWCFNCVFLHSHSILGFILYQLPLDSLLGHCATPFPGPSPMRAFQSAKITQREGLELRLAESHMRGSFADKIICLYCRCSNVGYVLLLLYKNNCKTKSQVFKLYKLKTLYIKNS